MKNELAPVIRKTALIFLVVVGLSLVCYFLYLIRAIVLQVIVAILLAVALEPAVRFFMKRRFNRLFASITAVLLTFIVVLGLGAAITTPLITEGTELIANAPAIFEQVTKNATFLNLDTKYQILDKLQSFSYSSFSTITGGNGFAFGFLGSIFGAVASFFVVIVLSLFLLIEGPGGWKKFLSLFGAARVKRITDVVDKMSRAVSGFVLGSLLTAFIAGTVALTTLLILKVPYAFALAGAVAFLDLIPLIGTTIATVIVTLVVLTQGIVPAIIVVVILLSYQVIEGNILQPLIYSRTIALSPLIIILASIIGASVGGVLGVVLAIPFAAVGQIAVIELFKKG